MTESAMDTGGSAGTGSDIVVYGSSRAWVHFDSQIMEDELALSTYNLGIDGHNFWLQYLRHQTLLKYNKKPKAIILSVDVFSLQKRSDLYNYNQFLPYMLYSTDLYRFTNSYNGFNYWDYNIPLLRYNGKIKAINEALKNALYPKNLDLGRKKGFKGIKKVWNTDLEEAKKKSPHYEIALDTPSIGLFENFLEECKEKNIQVIMVYAPEYIEGQSYVINRKEIISYFENYSNIHDIPFIDYSGNVICTKKEYFYNSLHLNKKGAERFTNLLITDIKKYKYLDD